MKSNLLFLVYIFGFISVIYAESKGFTQLDIDTAFQTRQPVSQILSGFFPQHIGISENGRLMAISQLTKDIRNNKLYVLKTDGTNLRKIPTPYGYKSNPFLIGRKLYFNFNPNKSKKSKGFKKGRYVFDLSKKPSKATFLFSNILDYTTHNQPSVFDVVKSGGKMKVQFFYKGGASVHGYRLAENIGMNIRAVLLDREKRFFYISAIKMIAGKFQPEPNIFRTENMRGAKAVTKLKNSINPSIGITYRLKHILLYCPLDTSDVLALNIQTNEKFYVVRCNAELDYHCRLPTFSPSDNRFYFIAQKGVAKFGLFQSRMPDMDSLEKF
jgi:hypothetical protein